MRSIRRIAGVLGHLLLAVAAVVAVLAATSDLAYPPLRLGLVVLVAVLSAVTLFGRLPFGLGPVAGSVSASAVRMVGTILGGVGAAGVVLGFGQGGTLAALLATVTACQTLFYAAAVLYQYGPDAWMPYAGPGPLTPQAQLEQNRAEAIDPYVGLFALGTVAATILIGMVLTARKRAARVEAASPAVAGA